MEYHVQYREASSRGNIMATGPLKKDEFCKVWKQYCPTLKMMKPGQDYCNKCTQLRKIISTDIDDETRESLTACLEKQKGEEKTEFGEYRKLQNQTRQDPLAGSLHLVFDFPEKLLLPNLLRQTGQLQFFTGLKHDLFGFAVRKVDSCDIHCLPEGHWPEGKTDDEVASMLNNFIHMAKAKLRNKSPRVL